MTESASSQTMICHVGASKGRLVKLKPPESLKALSETWKQREPLSGGAACELQVEYIRQFDFFMRSVELFNKYLVTAHPRGRGSLARVGHRWLCSANNSSSAHKTRSWRSGFEFSCGATTRLAFVLFYMDKRNTQSDLVALTVLAALLPLFSRPSLRDLYTRRQTALLFSLSQGLSFSQITECYCLFIHLEIRLSVPCILEPSSRFRMA
jgi:hypothetical protein